MKQESQMTDEKGAREGPYSSSERADGRGIVEGLNFYFDCKSISEAVRYAERLNIAFASGFLQGAAKERKRCARIADGLLNLDVGDLVGTSIATKIRGGQDGK